MSKEFIMKVNFIDLKADKKELFDEVIKDWETIVTNANFVGGKYLEDFENAFAKYNKRKHCVGVGSGTDALMLALLAVGIEPNDQVIVPSNTFIATAFAATHAGARVIFADSDVNTYNMDANKLERLITRRTKVIIPVHLHGMSCDMDAIMEIANRYNLKVIEDCAQAAGAEFKGKKVGTFGDAGCFSFYPTKNLSGVGQGGAVITDSDEIARVVRSLGNVGRSAHTEFEFVGFNSRLDTINAAFLSKSLTKLDKWNAQRIKLAKIYNKELKELPLKIPAILKGAKHVYHLYTIKLETKEVRDNLKSYLDEHGVGSGIYYPMPCHKQPMYDWPLKLPVAEELSDTMLSLPMHHNLTKKDIMATCEIIKQFFRG
jgi:dTDP-4-amino-4,6-dideoxygalactose transaminase